MSAGHVNRGHRVLRAEQVELTRARILEAAQRLFAERGYSGTTIEAIADAAGVAVETVYSRFRNKPNILNSILDPAVRGGPHGADLFDQPAIAQIRACTDQREQIRRLAHFSRTILERTAWLHRIMHRAAATDASAAELARADDEHRVGLQRVYIDILLANGPLRSENTSSEASDTWSALANPQTYRFLVEDRGWSADRFEEWLADCLARVLLE